MSKIILSGKAGDSSSYCDSANDFHCEITNDYLF